MCHSFILLTVEKFIFSKSWMQKKISIKNSENWISQKKNVWYRVYFMQLQKKGKREYQQVRKIMIHEILCTISINICLKRQFSDISFSEHIQKQIFEKNSLFMLKRQEEEKKVICDSKNLSIGCYFWWEHKPQEHMNSLNSH